MNTKKSPLTTILLHWLSVIVLAFSFITGLRIAADDEKNQYGEWLLTIIPHGNVILLHLLSGMIFLALIIGYFFWLFKSKRIKRITKKNQTFKYYKLLHQIAYIGLGTFVISSVITGLWLFFNAQSEIDRIHRFTAYSFLGFIILHVLTHFLQQGSSQLLRIFRPARNKTYILSSLLFVIFSASGMVFLWLNSAKPLAISLVEETFFIDGFDHEKSWQVADKVFMQTSNGANLINGNSLVTIRAARDRENVYFYLSWQDPTRSQKHLPLIKTEDGWKIMQTDFMRANENSYYEDKFALLFAKDPLAVLKSIHLGRHPLKGQPASFSERGLHYTSGAIYDLWHWQSVRSNIHGQADDNFFGPPLLEPEFTPKRYKPDRDGTYPRYTAGYKKDPPTTWSGTAMNWEVFKEGITKPRRLPKDNDDLAMFGNIDIDPESNDEGEWWMEWNDTKPYVKEQDNLPIGSLLPSVLIKEPRAFDRGDIIAAGRWQDGYWHLELKRKLNTGSKYDVAIEDKTYVWLAAFDHTQTRHSRHLWPIKIIFTEH